MPPVIVAQPEAMRRFVQQEMQRAHSAEPAAQYLGAEKQPVQAILRRAPRTRAVLAQQAWQSDRLARASFAPGR